MKYSQATKLTHGNGHTNIGHSIHCRSNNWGWKSIISDFKFDINLIWVGGDITGDNSNLIKTIGAA